MNKKILMRWLFSLLISLSYIGGAANGKAAETSTNWNWFAMSLIVSNVNLAEGHAIPVSVVISNTSDNRHLIYYWESDPCSCGVGAFEIINSLNKKK